jgi:hypothetical protein
MLLQNFLSTIPAIPILPVLPFESATLACLLDHHALTDDASIPFGIAERFVILDVL